MYSTFAFDVTSNRAAVASNLSTPPAWGVTLRPIRSLSPFGPTIPMTTLLSKLANDPVLRTLHAASPRPSELPAVYQMALDQVGSNVAPYEMVKLIYDHNRASVLVLYGDNATESDQPEIIGILTVLYLSLKGDAAITDGTFAAQAVRREWLCAPDDEPAAIYAWAIAGSTRLGRIRLARVAQHLSYDLFGAYTQYGYAATSAGQALMEKLEFTDATPILPSIRPGTYVRWGRPRLRVGQKSPALPNSSIVRQ